LGRERKNSTDNWGGREAVAKRKPGVFGRHRNGKGDTADEPGAGIFIETGRRFR